MSVLVVVTYPDEHRAAEVLASFRRLQGAGGPGVEPGAEPGLEDAAVVSRDLEAHITLHQHHDLSGAGGPRRALWEALAALLVLAPPAGRGASESAAATLKELHALGVPEAFAVRVCDRLRPASSAICLAVSDAALPAQLELLRAFGGDVLRSPLAA
jgi:uncharacterized membrane protein